MKIIIIEDEKPAARLLQRRIEKLGYNVEVMLHSVQDSIHWLINHPHPDLIFLDIQLSDGLSFQIFDEIDVNSAIIFTTAYDEYALKAFKLNSVDYLLKPVDTDDLAFAIEKFEKQSQVKMNFSQIRNLFDQNKTYKERFTTKIGTSIKMITTDEVECFYSDNKATYAFTKEGKNYLLDYTLDKIEESINPKQFFRINRGQIIHIDAIKEISVYTNSRLKINLNKYNEQECIVSREKVNDFRNWLED
ncbi:LytR/AlgR family response regulator transcription factor [Faecalibacter bovis]|uniref:Response regulator transcription factor n=1 Tax=Faecalibacter bovis TaxID=2898187 RepID=A0ABX7XFE4_9FLAO|nr:LytTR family DNA-binding domain-containing protein [Faecalibacter bovis]QTV06655.1 response regulator transcription factor [Faecalibacter bovis]